MPPSVHRVLGLTESVDILIDRWGIPHIYAASPEDLFFAQGYNAARDRLFQLDLWRRRGLGLMAEAFGPEHVTRDRAARLMLYRGDMDAEWRAYGPLARMAVTRFVAGINAYLDHLDHAPDDLAPEFGLAGYRPARWAPEDVVRPRTHAPVFNLLSQFQRANVTRIADLETDLLRQHLVQGHRPMIPDDIDLDLPPEVLTTYLLATGRPPPPMPKDTVEGSNCWAVAPARTSTGRPLLANDPHRGYSTPSLRYLSHLCAPGLDVIGAGEPHMPGIALGHNGSAAFGFTVCPADTEDLVVCDLATDVLESVTETITVHGHPPEQVELQFSAHGPVLHVDPTRKLAYALRSTWFEPGTAPYMGSLRCLSATTWTEFDRALEHWGAPGENHVYADIHGTIATRSAGLFPKRSGYDGLLPVSSDTRRHRWNGFLAPTDFARTVDPATGFIASANEFNVPDGYRLPTYEWPSSDRHRRITDVLAAVNAHSLADSALLQNDLFSITAHEIVALLASLGVDRADEPAYAAWRMLTSWDAVESADSAAAALFETWWTRHLGPAVVADQANTAARELIPYPDPVAVHTWLLTRTDVGDRDRLLRDTLAAAHQELTHELGPHPTEWRWGQLHRNTQPHALGHLDPSLHVGPTPIGGSGSTVASASYWPADFSPFLGASVRVIIDVGAWDNSRCVNTPGQSGDPRSPHYRDLFETWKTGGYVPLLYSRTAVEQHTRQHLRLEAVTAR